MGIERGGGRPNDGYRYPGVTSILSRFKNSGGLMHWAYRMGASDALGKELAKNSPEYLSLPGVYAKRDEAGEIGSFVHEIVEAKIHGDKNWEAEIYDGIPVEYMPEVSRGVSAFLKWLDENKIDITHTEVPLEVDVAGVKFGGTFDALGRDENNGLVLLDWKTSSGIYPDHLFQVAAYALSWQHTKKETVEKFVIARFDKMTGEPEVVSFSAEKAGVFTEYFLHLATAYELSKKAEKEARKILDGS